MSFPTTAQRDALEAWGCAEDLRQIVLKMTPLDGETPGGRLEYWHAYAAWELGRDLATAMGQSADDDADVHSTEETGVA